MVAKVITIAQQKGGAGKTTLAIHLSVAWSLAGKSVALIDIDPQGSVHAWDMARNESFGADMPTSPDVRAITGWRTSAEVERLKRDYDMIVIDSPPHAETEAKIAIRNSDVVIIPCQPSPVDLWATKPIIDLAVMENVQTLTVMNRVTARANITDQIRQKARQLDTILAKTSIGNRVGFAESLQGGFGISEYAGSSPAAGEIEALAREIMKVLASSQDLRRAA